MGPYLATIVDSLREAIASRVLWIVVGLITLLLGVMSPLGYEEELSVGLHDRDVRDWGAFLFLLREQATSESSGPVKHIWKQLDTKTQEQIERLRIPGHDEDATNPLEFPAAIRTVRRALSDAMKKPEFHDAEAWKDVPIFSDEIGELNRRKPDEITEKELQRRNRLWLEAAFPDYVQVSSPTSIRLKYAWWNLGPPQPFREERFIAALKSNVSLVMNIFIGAGGVLIAILVTAPIVPQMFDQGSLNLLLSKPVRRSLLFLSKFVGGCGFIGVATIYLVGGLSLILGLRFGVWDFKLFWSIPLYLFLFSIYYSVSALAGVIWRNAIVSIAFSIIFWLVCFLVGTAKAVWESSFINKTRLAQVFYGGSTLFGVNEMGISHAWVPDQNAWKQVFLTNEQRQVMPAYYLMPTIPRQLRPVGPIYDQKNEQLVVSMFAIRRAKSVLYYGLPEDWQPKVSSASPPMGTFKFLREPDGRILAISSVGFFRLSGSLKENSEPVKIFGFKIPIPGGGPFAMAGPEEPLVLTAPADAAVDASSGAVATYSRGTLTRLEVDSVGQFKKTQERKFEGQEQQSGLLTIGGQRIVLARDDGKILVLDASTLESRQEFQPEGSNQPKSVDVSADGRWFAIVYHTGYLFLMDAQQESIVQVAVRGQGTISAASFAGTEHLLVVDRSERVTKYELKSLSIAERFEPATDLITQAYHYGLLPLYTVFPKPGELDKTFRYLLFSKVTDSNETASGDLTAIQTRFDPWGPVWSSALFVVCVLAFACVYIEWQEF